MKLIYDFLPMVLFFLSYKFWGIYVATGIAIIFSLLQICFFWLKCQKIEFINIITLISVLTLGTATLFFRNEMFIKLKPTAFYWIFALLLFGTQIIGTKPFIERLMKNKITLPKTVLYRLNLSWMTFFIIMGGINLYVAYNFNTSVWINFKLFGTIGATLVFCILQSFYITKFLKSSRRELS
ncbi:MAG: septation protein A [Coxiellaceae bacterium]|jgi:intracellular septation protein|nr:septation protein A [Coxiellaceae bacterium]